MIRYFQYLRAKREENGLINFGLGDWCPGYDDYRCPIIFTNSTITMSLAQKAAYLYDRLGLGLEAEYCRGFAAELRKSIREHLLDDKETMRFAGGHQTAQAMAIFYGLCDSEEEKQKAFDVLLEEIHEKDDHMGIGVLGGRIIFRVLCDYGYADLAIKMIVRQRGEKE